MSAIIRFVAPGQLSFLPAGKSSLFEHLEPKPTRLSLIREPEPPLWKLARRAVSPKFALIELFILVVFLTVALVMTASCLAELAHLIKSDAVRMWSRRRLPQPGSPGPRAKKSQSRRQANNVFPIITSAKWTTIKSCWLQYF